MDRDRVSGGNLPAVTSVCRVRWLLEAAQLNCKEWETARSVDATLKISRIGHIILEMNGKF